jgi:hypothetical protein
MVTEANRDDWLPLGEWQPDHKHGRSGRSKENRTAMLPRALRGSCITSCNIIALKRRQANLSAIEAIGRIRTVPRPVIYSEDRNAAFTAAGGQFGAWLPRECGVPQAGCADGPAAINDLDITEPLRWPMKGSVSRLIVLSVDHLVASVGAKLPRLTHLKL